MRHIIYSVLTFTFFCSLFFTECSSSENIPLKERESAYEFVAYTVPKSGSHLLDAAIRMLTGRFNFFYVNPVRPLRTVEEGLNRITYLKSIGRYEMGHICYDETDARLREKLNCKILFVYRDPRDTTLSFVDWIDRGGDGGPSGNAWSAMSRDEKIMYVLKNVHGQGINAFFRSRVGWLNPSVSIPVKFEDLVGEKGGGTSEDQLRQLREIADHIGLEASDDELKVVGDSIYGNSHTFNVGQICRWKKEFNEEHIQYAKGQIGDLLIYLGYEDDYEW